MKLLRVIASVDPRGGGPVEGIRQYAAAMERGGVATEVACLDAPGKPYIQGFPLTLYALGSATSGAKYGYTPNFVPWLRAAARRYDAVIVDGLWQFHGQATRRALRGTGVPYFVFPHGMLDPWFRRTYPMKHLKKALYWAAFERQVLRDARAVLFTNDEEMRLARQSFAPYRCREHAVGFGTSRPGADPAEARRAFLSAYPALEGKRVLLFLGRIDAKKGCDLLIDAFAAIAPCDSRLHLVMAGPAGDALGSGLRALVRRRGVGDRVTWTGMLSGIMKWGAFHAAEVFALPSHQENFGVAVAEALACGVPVAISNKVNLWRDIVEDDVGWVADDTRAATQAALQRWLATDPSVLPVMRERARRTFAARYDLLIQAPRLLCALERELAGARQMRTDPASAGATLTAR